MEVMGVAIFQTVVMTTFRATEQRLRCFIKISLLQRVQCLNVNDGLTICDVYSYAGLR